MFLGKPFGTGRVVTQGDLNPPMIFNIVVDVVAREMLEVVCDPQEAWHGMGWKSGKHNLLFNAEDWSISGRYHIWEQDALKVSVEMLRRMRLEMNLNKTKSLVCSHGYI